jgi:hypothetical protein
MGQQQFAVDSYQVLPMKRNSVVLVEVEEGVEEEATGVEKRWQKYAQPACWKLWRENQSSLCYGHSF